MSVFFLKLEKSPFARLGSFWKAVQGQKALSPQVVHTEPPQVELTESNFVFLLVSLEKILHQKTLEKKET